MHRRRGGRKGAVGDPVGGIGTRRSFGYVIGQVAGGVDAGSGLGRRGTGGRRHDPPRSLGDRLWRFAGQSRPNWALVGRWFWHLREGKVFHDDIGKAAPWAHELALGWVGHYVVGAVYGLAFALIAGPGWLAAPRLLPAWFFGIATLAFGWFLLQPGLGLGWAASRTPNPGRCGRSTSCATRSSGSGST